MIIFQFLKLNFKQIKTAVLYYNNKKATAIVDLKNKPALWNKAKVLNIPKVLIIIRNHLKCVKYCQSFSILLFKIPLNQLVIKKTVISA